MMWHTHPMFPYIEFTYCGKARYKKSGREIKLHSSGHGGYSVIFRDLTVVMRICPVVILSAGRFFGNAYFGTPLRGGDFKVYRRDPDKMYHIENLEVRKNASV